MIFHATREHGWHAQRLCDGRGFRFGAPPSDHHPMLRVVPRSVSRPNSSRDAQASGWKRAEPRNVCRSSTRQLALLGYDCERSACDLRRVGAGDCSPEPLTEPDWWTTHPALHDEQYYLSLKHAMNQLKDTSIRNLLRQSAQKTLVIDSIEEFR
jgi:hypothetical protein